MAVFGTLGGDETIRAYIARGRVREMIGRGWSVIGMDAEDRVLMEGPDPEGPDPEGAPRALAEVARPLIARSLAVAVGRAAA